MTDYRKGSHTVYSVHLHLVWITKYRKKVLVGEIGFRARDLIRAICERNRVDILKGYVGADHVHLLVFIPPSLAISKLMQQIKGKSSYLMLQEFKQLRRQYWGQHMWARGYFCCSTGNVTDEIIKNYIEQQDAEDDIFRVEGEL